MKFVNGLFVLGGIGPQNFSLNMLRLKQSVGWINWNSLVFATYRCPHFIDAFFAKRLNFVCFLQRPRRNYRIRSPDVWIGGVYYLCWRSFPFPRRGLRQLFF